jgi:hypothetical protein
MTQKLHVSGLCAGGAMPVLIHLLTALVIAAILGLILVTGLRRTGPWPAALGFLLLITLAAWAGGIWIPPFGPRLWGVALVPFLIAGILVALLLAALTPPREPSTVHFQTRTEKRIEERSPSGIWNIFFFSLLTALAVIIAVRYLFPPEPAF